MARISPTEVFDGLKKNTVESIKSYFPFEEGGKRLEVEDVWVDDKLDVNDIQSQQKAKLDDKTWGVKVKAKMKLTDIKTGKVLDRATSSVATLPKMTNRFGYIVGGNEYQVDNLFRLKSGVYTRIQNNGELESEFNLAKSPVGGRGFSVHFDPERKKFSLLYKTAKIPLLPILKSMGMADDDIKKNWGKEIYEANSPKSQKAYDQALLDFQTKTSGDATFKGSKDPKEYIKEFFHQSELRPDTTSITLGKPFDRVSHEVLSIAANKVLGVSRGTNEPDDRDSLAFKEITSTEDFIPEKIERSARAIRGKLRQTMGRKDKIKEIIPSGERGLFGQPVHDFFTKGGSVAELSDQTNPLQILSAHRKTTLMSEQFGGMKSEHSLTPEMKVVNPSHIGFLDVMKTPESSRSGITVNLSLQAQKRGKELEAPVFDLKSKKLKYVSAHEFHGRNSVLPDQVKWVDGKPVPIASRVKMKVVGGAIEERPWTDADSVMPTAKGMFDFTSNMIPFLPSDQGNRVSMADKQMEQAISLKHREAPLVQTKTEKEKTFDKVLGNFASQRSPVAGKVTAVRGNQVTVKDAKNKSHNVHLYDHFPTNDPKGMFHSESSVKVGDHVSKGDTLADTNFTKGGNLALGTNLRVGYVPFKGYNFEDGVVVSETASKKLTSEHLYKESLSVSPNDGDRIDKNRFVAVAKRKIAQMQPGELDAIGSDGVVRVGSHVQPGQVLVTAVGKSNLDKRDHALGSFGRRAMSLEKDKSLVWNHSSPGKVVRVVKSPNGKEIKVHVKTEEPLVVGDKVAGRHGNKGIVTKILPDDEMPFTVDSKTKEKRPIHVLLNPTGVPCYDDKTEFLTDTGWVQAPKIHEEHRFATINPKTLTLEFQDPEEVYHIPYTGKMYRIQNQQLDLLVTPHHKQFTAKRGNQKLYGALDLDDQELPSLFSLDEAQEIIGQPRRYLKAAKWKGDSAAFYYIEPGTYAGVGPKPTHGMNIPASIWAEFMGWFLSEGSTYFNKANYSYVTEISQDKNVNPENYDRIRTVMEFFGLTLEETDSGIRVKHKGLFERLALLGKAREKYIPREILDMEPRHLRLFLDAAVRGDGSETWDAETGHYGNKKYWTASKRLADGIQEVAAKLGIAANIKRESRRGDDACYYISLSGSRLAPWVNWSSTTKSNQVEEWEDYDGVVHCATVPNGTLLVRRNGKAVFSGNTRINVGQVLETAAGKIAEKTGKPFIVDNFGDPKSNNRKMVADALKAHGLTDEEDVYDPSNVKKPIGSVLVGPQHILKLQHQVEKKLTSRGGSTTAGGAGLKFDSDRQPQKGGEHGSQGFGQLELYSLLAHGAKHNIREFATYKSDEQNEQFWAQLQSGREPPPPKVPFAYNKFEALLKGLGVNVEKHGTEIQLLPSTDRQTIAAAGGASGELKKANLTLQSKTLREEKGGLFDKMVTGGKDGNNWSYIKLTDPMPNPVFVGSGNLPGPIPALLGMKIKDVEDVMKGKTKLHGKTGGEAIKEALSKINVTAELAKTKGRLHGLTGSELDRANKRFKYLSVLKDKNLRPEDAYMMSAVPVLPPKFRPVQELPTGDLSVHPLNGMYKNIAILNQKLVQAKADKNLDDDRTELAADLYDKMKALQSVGGSSAFDLDSPNSKRKLKGIMETIAGTNAPKEGYFQDRLVKKRLGMSMRSTITPEPRLSLDEVGIPRNAAMEMYKTYVQAELVKHGISRPRADLMIRQNDPVAHKALETVIGDRPVILKRDPALHKFSVMGFKPKIVEGKSIQIHPLVTGGFNADFDGDQQLGSVLVNVSEEIYNSDLDFWKPRRCKVSARFEEVVGFEFNGYFAVCNLEDFPRSELVGTKDHIEFWTVPEGVKVAAVDEASGKVTLTKVSHWSLHLARKIEIVNLGSGRQIITDDDERAVYGLDASSLEWCRRRPKDAKLQFVPVVDESPRLESFLSEVPLPSSPRLKATATLDESFGYFMGAMVGDGWASFAEGTPRAINIASSYGDVDTAWKSSLLSIFKDAPTVTRSEATEGKLGNSTGSTRFTVSCVAAAKFIAKTLGRSAQKKHLPTFATAAPKSFILGLLGGLWDTDGSMSWSKAKAKKQFMCSYSSTSIRLVQEIQYLLRMLGVSASITPTETPAGGPAWVLTVSTVDLYRIGGFPVHHSDKKAHQTEFLNGAKPDDRMAYSRYRLVPTPSALASEMRSVIGSKEDRSLYITLSKAIERQYMSKNMAEKLLDIDCSHPLFNKWKSIVQMPGVHFERVDSVEVTNIREDGYDLTVPDHETFMSIDGIVLSNTMAATIPMTQEAVAEARKMFPSKHLFSSTNFGVMHTPGQEAIIGLNLMTRWGKKTNKKFRDIASAKKAYKGGSIELTDVIELTGSKGPTTVGRLMIAEKMPHGFSGNHGIMHDSKFEFTKKSIKQTATKIANEKRGQFANAMDNLKDLGNEFSYSQGFSFGLKDLETLPRRDSILAAADKKAAVVRKTVKDHKKQELMLAKIYEDATNQMEKHAVEHFVKGGRKNRLMSMVYSGSRGSESQLRQMIAAPMMMIDHSGKVITNPARKSYSEGLDIGDYWKTQHGARKGTLDRAVGTQEPGALTKDILNSTMNIHVVSKDCMTTQGVHMALESSDGSTPPDIFDRYTSVPYTLKSGKKVPAGSVITPALVDQLKESKINKILCRSPLKCQHGKGICSKCFGLNENGELHSVGTNIGVLAGQALGEPVTQMAMDAFHSGGVAGAAGAQKVDKFTRLKQLLNVHQTLKDSATLARVSGTITSVKKDAAGGLDIFIGKERHYVPAKLVNDGIKVGTKIIRGQSLSHPSSPVNPHHLLGVTGDMSRVQNYITEELAEGPYKGRLRRRNVEVAVRGLTNVATVTGSGTNSPWQPGDKVPLSVIEMHNRKLKKKDKPVEFSPQLVGSQQVPLTSTDWMARLNYQRLPSTIMQAASQGWKSDIHGQHPIPGIVYGAEFGKPPKGKLPGSY